MSKKEIFLFLLEKVKKKEDVKDFVSKIEDNDLKETSIFVADEFLQNSWDNLIEKNFFNTAYGGEKFFINLDYFITEKNYEMLEICLLSLKLGFKGAKSDTNSTIKKVQSFLAIENRIKNFTRENFSQKGEKVVSLTACTIPFILIIFLRHLFQLISLKLIYWRIR